MQKGAAMSKNYLRQADVDAQALFRDRVLGHLDEVLGDDLDVLAELVDLSGVWFKHGDFLMHKGAAMSKNNLPPMRSSHDLERVLEFEFVGATENAALNAIQWL